MYAHTHVHLRALLQAQAWEQGIQPGVASVDEAPITPLVDQDPAFKSGVMPMPDEYIDMIRRFFRLAGTSVHRQFTRFVAPRHLSRFL